MRNNGIMLPGMPPTGAVPAGGPPITLSTPLTMDALVSLTAAAVFQRSGCSPEEAVKSAVEIVALSTVAIPKVKARVEALAREGA
jgi:hypothetical protein